MYQPLISEDAVRSLYRVKRAYHRPMTQLLEEFVVEGLRGASRVSVCSACQSECNNTDCNGCYFGQR
jgi:hypothetical protein